MGAFGCGRNRTSRGHEQVGERRVNAVANESTHAASVVAFPQRIGRQWYIRGPARNGARWNDNRVADSLVPAATPIEHSRQHGHVQVGVVVDSYLTLAVIQAMQPSDVLRNRSPPRDRQRQEQRVQARIVESLSDVFASRQDDATFFPWDGRQPFGLYLSLLLPHSTSKDHDVTNVRGKLTLKTCEVLVAFCEHERRSPVTHGLHDLVGNRSIPGLVINQELVKRLELNPFVGRCAARWMKGSGTDEDGVLEGPRGRLRPCVHAIAYRAALHEDDRLVTVLPRDRRGQTSDESSLCAADDLFKAVSRQVVAFIDDHLPIVTNAVIDDTIADEALNDWSWQDAR